MKATDATVDQLRTLFLSIVGVLVLFSGLKAPLNPTWITTGCSMLGLEPAIRTKPREEPSG